MPSYMVKIYTKHKYIRTYLHMYVQLLCLSVLQWGLIRKNIQYNLATFIQSQQHDNTDVTYIQ